MSLVSRLFAWVGPLFGGDTTLSETECLASRNPRLVLANDPFVSVEHKSTGVQAGTGFAGMATVAVSATGDIEDSETKQKRDRFLEQVKEAKAESHKKVEPAPAPTVVPTPASGSTGAAKEPPKFDMSGLSFAMPSVPALPKKESSTTAAAPSAPVFPFKWG